MIDFVSSIISKASKPRRHLSCADTAKLVRKALKEAFPEIKFSVRSSTYAGGASIDVRWKDGPLGKQVDPIIKVFAGARFNGMTDSQSYVDTTLDGSVVSFGTDYVHSHREVSTARIDNLEAILIKVPQDMWLSLAIRMRHPSAGHAVEMAHGNARDFARALLMNCGGEAYEGRKSALADSVTIFLDD